MNGRATLFDLDNTLHDRDAGVLAFLKSQHDVRALARCGIALADWTERFVALEERGRVWKDVVYARLVDEFGLALDPASLLDEYETEFARHIVPFEGLVETLAALRETGWRTGLVTNGRAEFQRRTLAALQLEPLFETVVISEECGLRKPDPAIFRLALSALGTRAEDAWFVGDDPLADVEGAARAGMRTLLFRPGAPAAEGQIGRLADVLAAIA